MIITINKTISENQLTWRNVEEHTSATAESKRTSVVRFLL